MFRRRQWHPTPVLLPGKFHGRRSLEGYGPWSHKVLDMTEQLLFLLGFPCGSAGKESACNARDLGSIPGLEKTLAEGNDYPLQYSCLEKSMYRGAWWATVHGVTKCGTLLSD